MTHWRLRSTLALSVTGVAVAGYMSYVKLSNSALVCLGGGSGCETVQNSIYAQVGPMPVALLGLGGYLTFLLVTALQFRATVELRRTLAGLNFGLALGAFLYSLYLTYLQRFVIKEFCTWCLVSATLVTLILILTIWELRALSR